MGTPDRSGLPFANGPSAPRPDSGAFRGLVARGASAGIFQEDTLGLSRRRRRRPARRRTVRVRQGIVRAPSKDIVSQPAPQRVKRAGAMVSSAVMASRAPSSAALSVTGMPAGPFAVGVTTLQLDDHARTDPESGGPRRLQTEIWYPADPAETAGLPAQQVLRVPRPRLHPREPRRGGGARRDRRLPGRAHHRRARRDVAERAVRDARPCGRCAAPWPLVVFSHGSGAFRASYVYWTELLARTASPPPRATTSARRALHAGRRRGRARPGGARSTKAQMEADRPADVRFVLGRGRAGSAGGSRHAGLDRRCARAARSPACRSAAGRPRPRSSSAPTRASSARSSSARRSPCRGAEPPTRAPTATPVMVMLGAEDTVIGAAGNEAAGRRARHEGPRYLVEMRAAAT